MCPCRGWQLVRLPVLRRRGGPARRWCRYSSKTARETPGFSRGEPLRQATHRVDKGRFGIVLRVHGCEIAHGLFVVGRFELDADTHTDLSIRFVDLGANAHKRGEHALAWPGSHLHEPGDHIELQGVDVFLVVGVASVPEGQDVAETDVVSHAGCVASPDPL